jgi:Protein of unknown function (DUF3501).
MSKLKHEDLMSLEEYHEARDDFRRKAIEHKKIRQVPLDEHATLYFEDRLTMQYQIQEMLRIEKIFQKEAIQEELDAYNPLIPDGTNWKATFMLEYTDVEERKKRLAELVGIEHKVYVKVDGHDRVYAIANEDLERSTEDKTSSVHFLRFELTPEMIESVKRGEPIYMGIDYVGSSRVDLQACKLEYSIVSPK